MGLKLTLNVQDSYVGTQFIDAYWKIDDLRYSTTDAWAHLVCYPTREASKLNNAPMPEPSLSIGAPVRGNYYTELYQWNAVAKIADVFPNGIPLDENEQKTAMYNWIKEYTHLPFEDVFEN